MWLPGVSMEPVSATWVALKPMLSPRAIRVESMWPPCCPVQFEIKLSVDILCPTDLLQTPETSAGYLLDISEDSSRCGV